MTDKIALKLFTAGDVMRIYPPVSFFVIFLTMGTITNATGNRQKIRLQIPSSISARNWLLGLDSSGQDSNSSVIDSRT